MKILFITDLYPIKSGEKTTPKTLHNFVKEWVREGHLVEVVKPNFLLNSFLRKKPFYNEGVYGFEGVRVLNLNFYSPFLFDVEKKLPKDFDIKNYDVIVAHMPSGIIFADKLAKKFNKPLVCGIHSSDFAVLKNPLYKFYFRQKLVEAYKNAKKIACRSFVIEKKFKKMFPELAEKTFAAPSGVENLLLENCTHFTSHLSPLTILTCANLIKRKNIDKLILALKGLEGFELKIVGDGPELKKLKRIVSFALLPKREKVSEGRMRGSSKTEFLGQLPHDKVLEEMRSADIFVLPSVNETFGMVYLEAMASGCVVVCTKDDGVDGIIVDVENGFLTLPTVEGIRETLLKIKYSEVLEKIVDNSLSTVKNYSQENCARSYLEKIGSL